MPPPAYLGLKVRQRKAKELRREDVWNLRPVSGGGTIAVGGAATPVGREETARNVPRTLLQPRMLRLGIVLRSAHPKDRVGPQEPQGRQPASCPQGGGAAESAPQGRDGRRGTWSGRSSARQSPFGWPGSRWRKQRFGAPAGINETVGVYRVGIVVRGGRDVGVHGRCVLPAGRDT